MEEFKEVVNKTSDPNLKLVLIFSTRWNSTFEMLDRALSLKSSINSFLLSTKSKVMKNFEISYCEWNTIEELIIILKPFNTGTKALCFEKNATLANKNLIFSSLMDHLENFKLQSKTKNLEFIDIMYNRMNSFILAQNKYIEFSLSYV